MAAAIPATATIGTWTALPALWGAVAWIALAVWIGVVVLTVIGLLAGPQRRAAVNAPGLLLVAASIGAMLGDGVAGQVVRLTGAGCGRPAVTGPG